MCGGHAHADILGAALRGRLQGIAARERIEFYVPNALNAREVLDL